MFHLAMRKRLPALIGVIVLSGMLLGCDKGEPDQGSGQVARAGANTRADATYEVRGVVRALPEQAGGPLVVQHEAIPTFTDPDGKKVGMMAMTMPFAVAGRVSLQGVNPGDKIAFTYEVRFESDPRNLVTRIVKLPTSTQLKLSR